jgi:hypothetical protein
MAAVCVRARGLLRVESDPRFDRPRSNGSILDESEQQQLTERIKKAPPFREKTTTTRPASRRRRRPE